ncbi:MAG: hypothetical protein HKN42_13995 [Granulosicoccus sp.]|nr:hypothetical protein [Granulosicoccus sp.]
MKISARTCGVGANGKTLLALVIGSLSTVAMAWDVPTNLREDDDVLMWDSSAPSHNIYEDGMYIATVHGVNRFEPIFDNSAYQVVAHDFGQQFTPASASFLFIDDQDDDETDDEEKLEFEEAELYFELNNTDGDLGIHSVVDGEAWTHLVYEDRNGRPLIDVQLSGAMAKQGLTEFFFESAEPTFDEVSPAEFFSRFPSGVYDFEGTTVDGENIEAEAILSAVLPAPAVVTIGANSPTSHEGCADDPSEDPVVMPDMSGGLQVQWKPVVGNHPEIGESGEVEIELYQFVYEGEEVQLTVDLDPDTTEFTIPAEFVNSGDPGKLEVIVRDSTHNQVGTEACFQVL